MNERIKALMGKTLDSEFSHTWDTMTYEGLLQFSEKFAELILKECIMVCWPGGESDVLYEQASEVDKAFIDGQDYCVEKLKKHFGVE